MSWLPNTLRQYLWFLYETDTLFEGAGLYSSIRVTKRGDRVNLYTGDNFLQSSYNPFVKAKGTHFEWYLIAPWFSGKFDGNLEDLLILGLGGGVQVKLYNKYYKVKNITGVEIDPQIVNISTNYFELKDSNLKIICSDAYDFIKQTELKYDLIIVDSFKENKFEESCSTDEFIKESLVHLKKEGVFFVNQVIADNSVEQISSNLKKYFKSIYTVKVNFSIFVIATNSSTAPKDVYEVYRLIKNIVKYDKRLAFVKTLRVTDIDKVS